MQKKRIILLLILSITLSSGWLSAQHGERKSIELLQSELLEQVGAKRIHTLHALASSIRYQDSELAMEYIDEAYDLSVAIGNDTLKAESLYRKGSVFVIKGKQLEAIDNYIEARQGFNELGFLEREVRVIQSMASTYMEIGQYEEASKLYFKALEYSEELGDEIGEVFSLTRLGMVQQNLGEYGIAQRFLHDAIDKAREIGDWGGESIALAEAGLLEEKMGNPDKAIEYYQNTISIFNEKNIQHGVPGLLNSIAMLYKDEDKLNEALAISLQAVGIADSLGNKLLVTEAMRQLSVIYNATGDFQKGIETLEEALSIAEQSGITSSSLLLMNMLSGSYLESGNLGRAKEVSIKARNIAFENRDWNAAKKALEVLIESELALNNFEDAFEHQQELLSVKDSIIDKERTRSILEFEARYRINQKEKEIALLQAENEKRAIVQATLGGGILLLLILAFLALRSQRLKIKSGKAELELSNLKHKKLEQDLEFKNKQLTTQSLNMVQKNEMMEELREKVENIKKEGGSKELNSLAHLVDYSFSLDEDWKQFQMHFEEVHSGFYHILKERYPDLTPNEMRLSALVKLNLSIKEMAAIMGISPDSVKTARYRLRKKLELNTEENLTDFMLALEKASFQEV